MASFSHRYVEMAHDYIQGAATSPKGSAQWANCTAAAFDLLLTPECSLLPKPEWWHDGALKILSETVVRVVDNGHGHMMRATVLSGQQPAWELSPRSAADLTEAAKHYSRAAKLARGPVQKLEFNDLAATHLRKAAAVEAAEAAEAETKAVARAAAEAKAHAAADALLAEEEALAERKAAAAKRAGKAASKGSKGSKGKSKGKSSGKQ